LPSNTAQSLQIEQMSINFKKLFNFVSNKLISWLKPKKELSKHIDNSFKIFKVPI
jgi:hypothetical protein